MTDRDIRQPIEVANPWAALVAIVVGLSIIVIDGSVVNVLLPSMIEDLGLTQTDAQWVNSIYSLVFASLLITVGRFADRYGRRRLFLTGIVIFVLGSLGSASSQSSEVLIAFRAVQAFGASMMLPSSIAFINVLFTGKKRAIAFGIWGAVFAGAAALGPLLGGWLAQDFSWRWAFLINIPIGIAAGIAVLRLVPESRGERGKGFDPVGIALSAAGLALVIYGLIEGGTYGWWTAIAAFDLGPISIATGDLSIVPMAIFCGVVLLLILAAWEMYRSRSDQAALIDTSLFRIRRFGFGNFVALIVALGEFGILFVLPLWMQSVHALDPLTTGTIIAFLAIGTIGAGGSARRVSERIGATMLVRLGMVLEIIGIIGIALVLSVDRSPWWLTIPLIIYGLGVGFDAAQLTNVVLADVPPIKSGQASAMTSTFRQVGSALGAAVLGAILFGLLSSNLTTMLAADSDLPLQEQEMIVDEVRTSAGQAIIELEEKPDTQAAADDAKVAFTDAARTTAFAAAGFILVGLVASFGLPPDRRSPGKSDDDPANDDASSNGV